MPSGEACLVSGIQEDYRTGFDEAPSRNRAMFFVEFRCMSSASGHASMRCRFLPHILVGDTRRRLRRHRCKQDAG
jgi:hypothetical protein